MKKVKVKDPEEEDDEEEEEDEELEKLSVIELKDKLRQMNLRVTGKKVELVQRIREAKGGWRWRKSQALGAERKSGGARMEESLGSAHFFVASWFSCCFYCYCSK